MKASDFIIFIYAFFDLQTKYFRGTLKLLALFCFCFCHLRRSPWLQFKIPPLIKKIQAHGSVTSELNRSLLTSSASVTSDGL